MKLMIGQIGIGSSGSSERVVKLIIGIIHAINLECRTQTTFIKRAVMRHKRQTLNVGHDLLPHFAKHRCIVGVAASKSMHRRTAIGVIIGFWLDERIKTIDKFATTHHNYANRTHTAPFKMGGVEIYGCKIFHFFFTLYEYLSLQK